MTRNRMWVIALLMAFALIGLIVLQINWIRHDYAIREEKFGQQVAEAINDAIAKIETRESVRIIARNVNDSFLEDSVRMFFSEPSLPRVPEPVAVVEPFIPDSVEIAELNSFTFVSAMDSTDVGHVSIITHTSTDGGQVSVKVQGDATNNSTITTLRVEDELKRADAVLSEQYARSKQKELEMFRKAAARDQERVKRKVQKLNKVFEKMAVEYDRRTFNLTERISPPVVDSIVGVELKNNGILLPYSISLQSGKSDSIVWKRTGGTDPVVAEKEYSALLFPGDITNRNDLIKIGFTDTFRYFISSMWIMLMSSAIFTLIVIFAFSYTLHIILKQKKLSEIKNDFINNMTHEFKTPIATIRLATEAISNPDIVKDEIKVRHYAKIIRDENDRMNSHVENILQMAQFDKKSFARELERTNMHEVIAKAIEMMKLQTDQKGGIINFKQGAVNSMINADPGFIAMVIINLLDNALKYTDKPPVIEIVTENLGDKLLITISDNGIGMQPEMCKKIFEKFYRVSSGNVHNVKGFGLGLSYVKAIVTAHEGTINAQSELGKGSSFIISIPTLSDLRL